MDGNTLWAACVEVSPLGGPPKFKAFFKHELVHTPGEPTRRMYFFSEAVKLVIAGLGVKAASVAMVFPDSDTFVRYFEMPKIPSDDMRAAVSFEAQKFMPFPMRDLYFDHKAFPNPDPKKQGVVLVASARETVDLWKKAVSLAGHTLDFVEPESMAFFRLMRAQAARESDSQVKIYLGLRQGGLLTFIAARGAEVLMSSPAKIPPPMAVVGQEPKKIEGEAVARQAVPLLSYFSKNFRGLKIQEMIVAADPGCCEENMETVLAAQMGFPVRRLSRTGFFEDAATTSSYAEAIVLNVSKARIKPLLAFTAKMPMNIVGISFSKKADAAVLLTWEQEAAQLKSLALIEAAIVSVLILLLHMHFLGQMSSVKKNLAQINAEAGSYSVPAEILNAADVGAVNVSLLRKNYFLSSVYGARVFWTPKLAEVARLIPVDVTLDVLEINGNEIAGLAGTLRLEGHFGRGQEDMAPVNQFIEALKSSPTMTAGLGTLKISKLRKIGDSEGNYTSSIFFIDTETAEKKA